VQVRVGVGSMEVWRCAASVLPLCLKSSGDAVLEILVWRRAAGVGTCGSLPLCLKRCAAGVASLCQELWSSGGVLHM